MHDGDLGSKVNQLRCESLDVQAVSLCVGKQQPKQLRRYEAGRGLGLLEQGEEGLTELHRIGQVGLVPWVDHLEAAFIGLQAVGEEIAEPDWCSMARRRQPTPDSP